MLVGLALLFGAATVLYPFGGDQGLYYYVGREWLHGSVPYRDAMEQKTPLIFLLHMGLVALTGQNMWAIRVAELALIVPLGWLLAELATPPGETRRPGLLGLGSLATSVLYFGLFNYWDTAQCEIWYVTLSLLSLWVVLRRSPARSDWILAGLLGGLAWLTKPPAALLLAVVVVALAWRAYRHAAPEGRGGRSALQALVAYGAGAAFPVAATALYFLAVGALDELFDLAFRANYHDMLHSSTVSGAAELLRRFLDFSDRTGPLAAGLLGLALLGLCLAVRWRSARPARRYGLCLALLTAGCVAVAIQRKFYGYHWGVLAPLMAFVLVCAASDLGRLAARFGLHRPLAPAVLGLLLVVGWSGTESAGSYAGVLGSSVRYATGRIEREQFLEHFVHDDGTPYAEQEAVGHWITHHSRPDERIAVRGFEQTIYAVARRRAPTRFFWTRWLTEPRRAYRQAEWLAEDQAALRHDPPRYVIVNARARKGPASRAHFEAEGYRVRFRHGRLIVLERPKG